MELPAILFLTGTIGLGVLVMVFAAGRIILLAIEAAEPVQALDDPRYEVPDRKDMSPPFSGDPSIWCGEHVELSRGFIRYIHNGGFAQ